MHIADFLPATWAPTPSWAAACPSRRARPWRCATCGTGQICVLLRRRRRVRQRRRPGGAELRRAGSVVQLPRRRPAGRAAHHLPDPEQPLRHDRPQDDEVTGVALPGPARRRLRRRRHARRGRQRHGRAGRARRHRAAPRSSAAAARAPCSSSPTPTATTATPCPTRATSTARARRRRPGGPSIPSRTWCRQLVAAGVLDEAGLANVKAAAAERNARAAKRAASPTDPDPGDVLRSCTRARPRHGAGRVRLRRRSTSPRRSAKVTEAGMLQRDALREAHDRGDGPRRARHPLRRGRRRVRRRLQGQPRTCSRPSAATASSTRPSPRRPSAAPPSAPPWPACGRSSS